MRPVDALPVHRFRHREAGVQDVQTAARSMTRSTRAATVLAVLRILAVLRRTRKA
jgi:hypothetical protein